MLMIVILIMWVRSIISEVVLVKKIFVIKITTQKRSIISEASFKRSDVKYALYFFMGKYFYYW